MNWKLDDDYCTPAGRPPAWFARCSPWPELAFYPPLVRIVYRASRKAARGTYTHAEWVGSSAAVFRLIEGLGGQIRVEGVEHLKALTGPAVFVGNHMSTLETFVLPCLIQPYREVTFVVKQSLMTYPVFGAVMRSRDPITVGRTNPREDLTAVLQGGQERLEKGISIIVFPQTTRSRRFDPEQFNSIGAKLAARAGVPVVPMALRTDFWGNGKRLKDFGPIRPKVPVRFRFGAPLAPEGKGNAAHEATVRFIVDALGEWGCVSP